MGEKPWSGQGYLEPLSDPSLSQTTRRPRIPPGEDNSVKNQTSYSLCYLVCNTRVWFYRTKFQNHAKPTTARPGRFFGRWPRQARNRKVWGKMLLLSRYLWLNITIYTTIKTEDVCMCVCVSCLCRPPSHWWISFIFYTIIGLDPEGGQWLFKFKSNHNKKNNRQNAKQYMWDSSINLWSRT